MIIERKIFKKIENSLSLDAVTVLIGARQVGKTCILRYFKEKLEKEGEQVFYFDLEHLNERQTFNNTSEAIKYLKERGLHKDKTSYLFIDEIQYLDNPSNLIKILYDHHKHIKLIVSGSSTLKIKNKFKDSLAGRKAMFVLYPLNFTEYLLFCGKNNLSKIKEQINFKNILNSYEQPELSSITKKELQAHFISFSLYGGFPKPALTSCREEKLSIIQDIYESCILKDIKDFAHIENIMKFNNVVKFLSVQNTGLLNLLEVSKELGIARDTLSKYIFILENTFTTHLLPPYYTNRQKEITKTHKSYFVDTGMRNFILKDFRELSLRDDTGNLIENAVINEIKKQLDILEEIYFWRTPQKTEVDLILRREGGEVIPVEVKYKKFNSPKIPSGMKSFIKKYKPEKAVIFTKDFSSLTTYQQTKVMFLPVFMV